MEAIHINQGNHVYFVLYDLWYCERLGGQKYPQKTYLR